MTLADFLFEIGMLKRAKRTGFWFLGQGNESIAEHSYRTTVIGYVLAQKLQANVEKVLLTCLFHDTAEARTGDHNYVHKQYVASAEGKARQDQFAGLSFARSILNLLEHFDKRDTLEAKIAYDSDQLDMILSLKEEQDRGSPYAARWLRSVTSRLLLPISRDLAREIIQGDSAAWWGLFDSDKQDWFA